MTLKKFTFISCVLSLLIGCTSIPKFDQKKIRPWKTSLESEYPKEKPVIAHYKRWPYELTYLAAKHTNEVDSDTFRLVKKLFEKFNFKVLIIEPIPYAFGESPQFLLQEALSSKEPGKIKGGESGFAVIQADKKKIPYFGGEPMYIDFYKGMINRGYKDVDIIGFVLVRQIPQWVREEKNKDDLIGRKATWFITEYCKKYLIEKCPKLSEIKVWFRDKMGYELTQDIHNEDVAPLNDGILYTQKMSAAAGQIRDSYTLSLIEKMLHDYQRVAVIYGGSHLITLKKAFEEQFGPAEYTEDLPK